MAERPAGKITEVFTVSSEREAAFRLMENDDVAPESIAQAAHRATVRRVASEPIVTVPIDQTTLTPTDHTGRKGFGGIGDLRSRTVGLQVMSALAVTPAGAPQGLCGQLFWRRSLEPIARPKRDMRSVQDKETGRWLDVMRQVCDVFREQDAATKIWFQIDRGGDAFPLLLFARMAAIEDGVYTTIRAAHDRRLEGEIDGKRDYLWSRVSQQEPIASYALDVPSGGGRKPRRATMQIQACPVALDMQFWPRKNRITVGLWAVRVVEVGSAPSGEKPIEWLLLTTYPIEDPVADAVAVVLAYATRWRIEELHKIWKTGACNIEDSQLGDADNFERWATISASVAARLLRLVYLSRHQADSPATVELTRGEIDAIILDRKPKGIRRGATPTIGQAVRWIADTGGYTGKSSGGPPGAIVIARGLERIRVLARVLDEGKL